MSPSAMNRDANAAVVIEKLGSYPYGRLASDLLVHYTNSP